MDNMGEAEGLSEPSMHLSGNCNQSKETFIAKKMAGNSE